MRRLSPGRRPSRRTAASVRIGTLALYRRDIAMSPGARRSLQSPTTVRQLPRCCSTSAMATGKKKTTRPQAKLACKILRDHSVKRKGRARALSLPALVALRATRGASGGTRSSRVLLSGDARDWRIQVPAASKPLACPCSCALAGARSPACRAAAASTYWRASRCPAGGRARRRSSTAGCGERHRPRERASGRARERQKDTDTVVYTAAARIWA